MQMSAFKLVIITIIAGIATEYFLQNRWLGFFGVGFPLAGLYIYQEHKLLKKEEEKRKNKHKNKYR